MKEEDQRLIGFDALRFFMVLLIIIFHASITFMEFAPQYWYVLDEHKSLLFTILVVFLDGFPITILFFLAGYFSKPSFEKHGLRSFLLGKMKHIGIPWLLGVLFVAPFFSYLTYQSYDLPEISAWEFISKMFFGPFYQQAHYWFLGVLFFLFLIYSLFAKKENKRPEQEQSKSPIFFIIITWLISTAAYYLSTLIKNSDTWVNIGFVIYFQQSRLIGYIMAFLLGVYAYGKGWYRKDNWKPNWIVWGTISVNIVIFSLFWSIMIKWSFNETINKIMNAILYNTIATALTLFLTGLFHRFQNKFGKIISLFLPYSYGIYWLHLIVLTIILKSIRPINIIGVIKWVLSIILTLIICQIISKYVISQTKHKLFKK
jgi:peptidoglycan/LPS O-acetylase OafA/YrhL